MKELKSILIFSIIILAGCATDYGKQDSSSVASAVEILSSDFDKGTTYVGPKILNSHLLSSESIRLARKIGSGEGSSETILVVDFMNTGGGWDFYQSVSFLGGDLKELYDVHRKVLGCTSAACTHLEETILILPHGYIESKASSGFDIRYNSRNSGGKVISIPANYIQGFLAAVPD
ncbi:hypothetical protein [Halomonas heilongjiangensis]|uniref:hypothetical protein n=1 Tax=Halomonas heilongjiangensis TaxID=1387883 RepID=UPI0011AF3E29|nr:hypothetical protein [Halomonas heilongjiangensis]